MGYTTEFEGSFTITPALTEGATAFPTLIYDDPETN